MARVIFLQGTHLKHSSAYHPQTDGQSEVVNRCLDNYLHCFMGARPKDWAKWLLLVEWWYNTCVHLAMGITPYVAVYGTLPPRLLSYEKGTTRVQTIERILRSRDQVAKILKEH